jgi:prephenate dehydratase
MRIAYLGPAGTFTEDALREATGHPGRHEYLPKPTVHDVIVAVERGEADRAFVPFENSIEGSVRPTLDTLAHETEGVTVVGEHDFAVSLCLVAREKTPLSRIERVLSHPQPLSQCARFLRRELPQAEAVSASSTAEAVRLVTESERPLAAIGGRSAAAIYGAVVLREGVEDELGNVTRFVWIAPAGTAAAGEGTWKTSLVFAELGEDHPGALVEALLEFSRRDVNLTRIESRPLRQELGRYMFFVDIEGAAGDPAVAEAIAALREKAESVRVLGSYPLTPAMVGDARETGDPPSGLL